MNDAKTIEVTIERTIPASPGDVSDAWLDPKIPGTPWSQADKLLFNPMVDGFFYWAFNGTPHYGRFTAIERGVQIQHTWMSPNTSGLESTVSVTFKEKGKDTIQFLGANTRRRKSGEHSIRQPITAPSAAFPPLV